MYKFIAVLVSLIVFQISISAIAEDKIVRIDGSSTVFRLSEAVAEEFLKVDSEVRVTVGVSGTGGGFKKFCSNEIDLSDASRPIKATELEACSKNGIEFVELPVAYDALSVVVNKKNTWANSITVAELKAAWEPAAQGKVIKWNQIRSDWPENPLRLFGAGVDSGTYDYFTEAIVGKEDQSRGDYTSSEDDNVIVQGVSSDQNALGFFGYAYYEENKDKLKVLSIDDQNDQNGSGPISPSAATVLNGSYQPLARPLFIYINKAALQRSEVASFIKFYLEQMSTLAEEVGYIPLTPKVAALVTKRVTNGNVGSLFKAHGSQIGVDLEKILSQK